MYYMDEIELFSEPRNIIIPQINGNIEMTEFESAFLCGLIKRITPKKCVEVGIAEGGTTSVIMKCLSMIHGDNTNIPEIYAVDLSQKLYTDKNCNSGYLAKRAEKFVNDVKLELLLGDILPNRLGQIGGDIDFCLLDTTHTLPGEALDFLAVLPFMRNGGGVVFHDLITNQSDQLSISGIATPLVFHSINGAKYINRKPKSDWNIPGTFPNIGAVIIDDDVRASAINVAGMLQLPWYYIPEDSHLQAYLKIYENYYDSNVIELINNAITVNKNRLKNAGLKSRMLLVAKALYRGKV